MEPVLERARMTMTHGQASSRAGRNSFASSCGGQRHARPGLARRRSVSRTETTSSVVGRSSTCSTRRGGPSSSTRVSTPRQGYESPPRTSAPPCRPSMLAPSRGSRLPAWIGAAPPCAVHPHGRASIVGLGVRQGRRHRERPVRVRRRLRRTVRGAHEVPRELVGPNDLLRRPPACRCSGRERRDLPPRQGVSTRITGAVRRVRASLGRPRHGVER